MVSNQQPLFVILNQKTNAKTQRRRGAKKKHAAVGATYIVIKMGRDFSSLTESRPEGRLLQKTSFLCAFASSR